jgi:hypothetical protein
MVHALPSIIVFASFQSSFHSFSRLNFHFHFHFLLSLLEKEGPNLSHSL